MPNKPERLSAALNQKEAVTERLKCNYPVRVSVETEDCIYYGISLNDAMNFWVDNRETDDSRVLSVG